MKPTEEQAQICDFVAKERGSLIIDALAGSGKTSTLLMLLARMPQRSVLICAFNRRIADELTEKVNQLKAITPSLRGMSIHVKTFHAQGLSMIKDHYRHLQVSSTGTEDILRKAAGEGPGLPFRVKRAAVRLLRTLKETTATRSVPTSDVVLALGYEYDIFDKKMSEREAAMTVDIVRDGYLLSLDLERRTTIDYCDMVWAPIVCGLPPKSRYQAVLVDELQDISEPQMTMILNLMAPNGRLVGVGDVHQQIYEWRGSLGSMAWTLAKEKLGVALFPLTMTWRCSKRVVAEAQQIVPKIRAREDASEGSISECPWYAMPKAIGPRSEIPTFVLSRNNATILECALYLWRERVHFELNAGKEMLDPLFMLLDNELNLSSQPLFIASVNAWHAKAIAAAEKANSPSAADRFDEQRAMLMTAAQFASPDKIKRLLYDIITPNGANVLLSTVHKVKGLEADRVFLLKQTFGRHKDPLPCKLCEGDGCSRCSDGLYKPETEQEELNIEYVAITRARHDLIWVDINQRKERFGVGTGVTLSTRSPNDTSTVVMVTPTMLKEARTLDDLTGTFNEREQDSDDDNRSREP